MFREAMSFAKSNLHYRQNGQNFNKTGIIEIPEVVLEELIQNSLVHLDLLQPAAVRLLVFDNRIEIINSGALYGGINVKDLMLGVSKQRNPMMASLSGRTMIYRGLGSGILRALKENVKIDFNNEESANQFKVTIWRSNEGENPNNVAVNVAGKITERQRLILDTIYNDVAVNVAVNTKFLSEQLGVTRKTIQRDLAVLVDKQLIRWIGSDKTGHWEKL